MRETDTLAANCFILEMLSSNHSLNESFKTQNTEILAHELAGKCRFPSSDDTERTSFPKNPQLTGHVPNPRIQLSNTPVTALTASPPCISVVLNSGTEQSALNAGQCNFPMNGLAIERGETCPGSLLPKCYVSMSLAIRAICHPLLNAG